uniref:CAP domain-containing protein n=1 Tax=Strongyloides venezuelensis TaxID=75913 RepID=A0A0K0FIX1_STRVS
MVILYYEIIFTLIVLTTLTNQILLVPYLVKLAKPKSLFEYKGLTFSSIKSMVKSILKEKFIESIEEVCIYNAGRKDKNKIIKIISPSCQSILSYVYQHYTSNGFNILYPKSYRKDEFYCGYRLFYDFESALDYALKTRDYITFYPHSGSPITPLRDFCILTTRGRKCQMKDSPLPKYWKKIWSNCNSDCYFFKNFFITKKIYLNEINSYRKLFKSLPLNSNTKLSNLAQKCANSMAKLKRLKCGKRRNICDITAYAPNANGMYLIKLLFEDSYYVKRNTNKVLPKNNEMGRLLSSTQKFIGIGMTKKNSGVFICLKYSLILSSHSDSKLE